MNEVVIKFQRLNDDAFIPSKATEGSVGYDIYIPYNTVILFGDIITVKTGLRAEIPEGYQLSIRPRSGLAAKHGITVLNSPGTIDSDYRDEIGVVLINHSHVPKVFNRHDRIAQFVVEKVIASKFVEVSSIDETTNRTGGFGSTGL